MGVAGTVDPFALYRTFAADPYRSAVEFVTELRRLRETEVERSAEVMQAGQGAARWYVACETGVARDGDAMAVGGADLV